MKYLYILIIAVSLSSCGKKGCYKCTYTAEGKVMDTKIECDMTEREARRYERKNSSELNIIDANNNPVGAGQLTVTCTVF